jgi:chromosome segregation ATPase
MKLNLKTIGDSVSKVLFKQEDVPAKQQPIAQAPVRTPVPSRIVVTSANNTAYSTLLEKTAFETTDAGATLTKYLEPLKVLQIDEQAKYKAAAAQAGITVGTILGTFDGLKQILKNEIQRFEAEAADTANEQIADKRKRRDDIATQILTLQRQDEQLRKDIDAAQARIDTARKQFQDAVDLRTQELDGQKASLTRLLQG